MSNVLIINATPQEARVAVLEDGVISDFYLERRRSRGVVGNIYVGRVQRVLPGMQAAFIEIGLEKSAFLYVGDVYDAHARLDLDDEGAPSGDDEPEAPEEGQEDARPRRSRPPRRKRNEHGPIEEKLTEGQEVLVQVVKDAIGTKGSRVTCHISLPGRYLVFMPTVDSLGISRQISSDKERRRLRDIANEMRPKGGGFIVRTASEGVPSEYLRQDMGVLINLWNQILDRRAKAKPPKKLHTDLDLVLRATRDLATADLDRVIVDSREEYERILDFLDRVSPGLAGCVELYVGTEPAFDAYGIESEIERALGRKVELPSGGYLIIERTEALTAIDVNTGKFVGSENLEETIVRTNIEAAAEIAYQLRFRNIGGLIILDFIDMEVEESRQRVQEAFDRALEGDRGRVKVTKISPFGLIEMTRKRTRESLEQMLCEPCPQCEGRGVVRTRETVAYELLRTLRRELDHVEEFDVRIEAHPSVAQALSGHEQATLHELELRFNKKLHLKARGNLRVHEFNISGQPSLRQVQKSG